jgi:hypothetical protein
MKEIQLYKSKIEDIDLYSIYYQVDTEDKWADGWNKFLNAKPGEWQGHYKLLAYLSTFFNTGEILLDIGTLTGASSLALSFNEGVKVYSFDLPKQTFHSGNLGSTRYVYESDEQMLAKNTRENITYIVGDCLQHGKLLLDSSLIYVDIDHSGEVEANILNFLHRNNWNGIVVLDDIYWTTMQPLWNSIPENMKLDISIYGNGKDGTGLINFGNTYLVTHE